MLVKAYTAGRELQDRLVEVNRENHQLNDILVDINEENDVLSCNVRRLNDENENLLLALIDTDNKKVLIVPWDFQVPFMHSDM